MTPSPEPERFSPFLIGFGLVVLGHVLAFLLAQPNGSIALLLIGGLQILYVIPIVVIALIRRQTKVVQGALVAAGITFLLNGLFCAAMVSGFRHV